MPPPRGVPHVLLGPRDYDVTNQVHSDTYAAIDPARQNLSGRKVFISGGSRGLGRAMAIAFAKSGASSIAVGARGDMSTLLVDIKEAAKSHGRPSPTVLPIRMDVTDPKSVEAAAAQVEEQFGHCDIFINNAAILGRFGTVIESHPDEWHEVLQVNVFGPYLVSKFFLPLLLKSPESAKYLIQVSSVAAHLANPTLSAYQMSKLAVLKFSLLMDSEYNSQGVVSFSIHPGNVPTDIMGGPQGLNEQEKIVFVDTAELGANTLVFLTSKPRFWISRRYINCTWDMVELEAKQDIIMAKDLLKIRLAY